MRIMSTSIVITAYAPVFQPQPQRRHSSHSGSFRWIHRFPSQQQQQQQQQQLIRVRDTTPSPRFFVVLLQSPMDTTLPRVKRPPYISFRIRSWWHQITTRKPTSPSLQSITQGSTSNLSFQQQQQMVPYHSNPIRSKKWWSSSSSTSSSSLSSLRTLESTTKTAVATTTSRWNPRGLRTLLLSMILLIVPILGFTPWAHAAMAGMGGGTSTAVAVPLERYVCEMCLVRVSCSFIDSRQCGCPSCLCLCDVYICIRIVDK